mmetsp:Transcript_1312/g.3148  ORF Transcript_1312/g.3148 Transcript_1312/m.3148 type:complete len:232 (+) Transcript_1312:175-870(+)
MEKQVFVYTCSSNQVWLHALYTNNWRRHVPLEALQQPLQGRHLAARALLHALTTPLECIAALRTPRGSVCAGSNALHNALHGVSLQLGGGELCKVQEEVLVVGAVLEPPVSLGRLALEHKHEAAALQHAPQGQLQHQHKRALLAAQGAALKRALRCAAGVPALRGHSAPAWRGHGPGATLGGGAAPVQHEAVQAAPAGLALRLGGHHHHHRRALSARLHHTASDGQRGIDV